ncbi:MAG: response regulator, partial [Bacteroidales bacterium]|nr:response regulator [Bacteroidales bacterium]
MIFQKFTQVDSTPSRVRGGLGLGLSIADEIAKLLGGEISLESELGKGSTFYFSIAHKKSEAEISENRKINLKHKTILIVEDVESNYLYLEKLLTESGASVLWASTGHDAIAIAEKLDKIDLILMDIRMPDIDGYEITRKIKKIRSDIPIIAQTAYAMANDRKAALEAGCLDHISKPIKVDALLEIVNKHIKAKVKPGLVL